MKKIGVLVLLTFLALNPGLVLAHGDEDHSQHEEMQGAGHEMNHGDHAATLREAATALKASRPDLAEKLEKMAQHHEDMAKS